MLHPPNRGMHSNDFGGRRGGRNKHWTAANHESTSTITHHETERWDRGRGRGRGRANGSSRGSTRPATPAITSETILVQDDPVLETVEERDKFFQELVKQREIERRTAIAEGKMDDPLVPKRLEDAISIVGTCMDMCPRFERYRRERESNLFEWEMIPGTKRVDHNRAVKMYERAAGDKTIPSDLRPPPVLKKTLDYLFHDLLLRGGFSPTFNFIRDRSRAVRNDFTMQHLTDALAMECHERCARFHILALYLERDREGFSVALEEQQLMNTLQSLKEFYNDQRETYESPAELEMRIYHRLIHIRDQIERPEPAPLSQHVAEHPIYKLTTAFRSHVQKKSQPITKVSRLVVDATAMGIFGQLAAEMMALGGGGKGMVFLVACILERLFGKGTVEGIDDIRDGALWGEIIDGTAGASDPSPENHIEEVQDDELELTDAEDAIENDTGDDNNQPVQSPAISVPQSSAWASLTPSTNLTQPVNAFSNLGAGTSVFAPSVFAPSAFPRQSVFTNTGPNPFTTIPPAAPTSSSSTSGFTLGLPPRVQNNPLIPSNTPSPLSLASTSALPSSTLDLPLSNNIFAPIPTPAVGATTLDDVSGKMEPVSSSNNISASLPSTTLNPNALEFTPSSRPFPSSTTTTKPIFGVTPIPLFGAFPTSTSTSSFKQSTTLSTPPAATTFPKSTPPLAKIDTSPPVLTPAGPSDPSTPIIPPALGKVQPISLPSTPTVPPLQASLSNPKPTKAVNPLLGFLKDTLQTTNLGPGGGEMLSPLVISSPSVTPLRNNYSPAKRPRVEESPLRINGDIKGKGKQRGEQIVEVDDGLDAKALTFERRGLTMRESFGVWKKRTTDHAEWAEAVKNSDRYSRKVRREREQGVKRSSPNARFPLGASGGKRPRMSVDEDVFSASTSSLLSAKRKRQTPRKHKYETPRTDEELAKRLGENKEEHSRRWAQGSFLSTVRSLVKSRCRAAQSASAVFWQMWLSLNPESDATAIWLETKFDVQNSGGNWETDMVFSIPAVLNAPVDEQYPGLIIFECTPLEGIDDDLERKYRILGDCSRLRDIIDALPGKRHFIPSLLLFVWSADGSPPSLLASDLQDMVAKYVSASTIANFAIFHLSATSTDVDGKFQQSLSELDMDIVGRLVQSLSLKDVFKLFEPAFHSFVAEWLENCTRDGQFNWSLYAHLLDAVVSVVNKTAYLVLDLIGATPERQLLPNLRTDWGGIRDSQSVFEYCLGWLVNPQLDRLATKIIATNLQSHRDMGREFPTSTFVDHLWALALHHAESLSTPKEQHFFVFPADIPSALKQQTEVIDAQRTSLVQTQRMNLRRSPRRRSRSLSEETDFTSPLALKRQRLSSGAPSTSSTHITPSSSPPQANSRNTPSPTASTVSLSSSVPIVTASMLRALTRDMKSKYVKKSR
ncbi:Nuclear export factor [Mycena indigotica]|uniref:Nuclear export factor n=1 Tax=Mycena indigotica TaxID=2126181 RepID=A0A8H6RZ11_9AGAR|nr:Nuclear export factor [Mycena indigotica]KAF7289939.1 Nuclear export factor [Mycena indigotica]